MFAISCIVVYYCATPYYRHRNNDNISMRQHILRFFFDSSLCFFCSKVHASTILIIGPTKVLVLRTTIMNRISISIAIVYAYKYTSRMTDEIFPNVMSLCICLQRQLSVNKTHSQQIILVSV